MSSARLRFLTVLALLGLSACTLIQRDPRSGYYDDQEISSAETPAASLYQERRAGIESEAREELGLQDHPLTDGERQSVENRIRLKKAEARLETRREKKQYYGLRSALRSDRERLYFLSLPTVEARERWAAARGLTGEAEDSRTEAIAKTIEAKDIALGMSQKAVTESWGDPDAVEVAGDPLYGYERWKYNRYVSGSDGYQKEMRVVYFEGGRVVGWERP
jgi:hypothetical protein